MSNPIGIKQRSFAGGILADSLGARDDTAKYSTGFSIGRNLQILRNGVLANRSGSRVVAEVKDNTKRVRVEKFVFNNEQTYSLQFGDGYIRIARGGAQLVISPNPPAWSNVTTYQHGALVTGAGPIAVFFCIEPNTNNSPNGGANPQFWREQVGNVYEIPTPYLEAELFDLQLAQAGDVITITHENHHPYSLKRTGHTAWTLRPTAPDVSMPAPSGVEALGGSGTGFDHLYLITVFKKGTGIESIVGHRTLTASGLITGYTPDADLVVNAVAHGLTTGQFMVILSVPVPGGGGAVIDPVAVAQLVGHSHRVTVTHPDFFTLNDTKGVSGTLPAFTWAIAHAALLNKAKPTVTTPNKVRCDLVPDGDEYNLYKSVNGVYGFVVSSTVVDPASGKIEFLDDGREPDLEDVPPEYRMPWRLGDYPAAAGYYQQRAAFAGGPAASRLQVQLSRSADLNNFTTRRIGPGSENDSLTLTVASPRANRIRHLVDNRKQLLALTDGNELVIAGDGGGVIGRDPPPSVEAQTENGCSKVAPLKVDRSTLFIQERGSLVRDLAFNFDADSYVGGDLTAYVPHLVDGHTIVDWAYQRIPHSTVYAVRDDGKLLVLTHVPEQGISGWCTADTTGGFYESVSVVPEGPEHVLYAIVRRIINGTTKRFWERTAPRLAGYDGYDVRRDAFFVDCGASYDGTNLKFDGTVVPTTSVTISGPGPWTAGSAHTIVASAALFTAADVGKGHRLIGDDKLEVAYVITAFTDSTHVTATLSQAAPTSLQGIATKSWLRMVLVVGGLSHLNGATVAILSDGIELPPAIPVAGQLTLPTLSGYVHAGLPVEWEFQPLDLDVPEAADALANKKKCVTNVMLQLERARSFSVGPDKDHLSPWPLPFGLKPTQLYSGKSNTKVSARWSEGGRFHLKSAAPLPFSLLGMVRDVTIGKVASVGKGAG